MNTNRFKIVSFLLLLVLATTPGLKAQTLTNLHSFTFPTSNTNSDGANPQAGFFLSGNTLYGTTFDGGSSGNGTVFRVNTDGTCFTNLYSFNGPYNNFSVITNSTGANPQAGLVLSGNTLYGTAGAGGLSGNGAVFAINTDGTGFTNLHNFSPYSASAPFTNSDGSAPHAGLLLLGNTLYGTASGGGFFGKGTVFAINPDGTGFTNVHNFSLASQSIVFTNSDGANPQGSLVSSGNTLYGTAERGGSTGRGAIFKVNTDGTGFTNLHSFSALVENGSMGFTNGDGQLPMAGLVLSGNALYGMTESGGIAGSGTVFALGTDGTGFTNLHYFTAPSGPQSTNNDGGFPLAGLILSGNTLYGTTENGGDAGSGVVFAINTDGTGLTNLYSFVFTSDDGGYPEAGLILSGNVLYGTVSGGGKFGAGTAFGLLLPGPPQLTLTPSGTNVILTWPTNALGFSLQATTNIASPASWTTLSGQYAVTNPISGPQMFYRLSQSPH